MQLWSGNQLTVYLVSIYIVIGQQKTVLQQVLYRPYITT